MLHENKQKNRPLAKPACGLGLKHVRRLLNAFYDTVVKDKKLLETFGRKEMARAKGTLPDLPPGTKPKRAEALVRLHIASGLKRHFYTRGIGQVQVHEKKSTAMVDNSRRLRTLRDDFPYLLRILGIQDRQTVVELMLEFHKVSVHSGVVRDQSSAHVANITSSACSNKHNPSPIRFFKKLTRSQMSWRRRRTKSRMA